MRDYIHVMDLVRGHVTALRRMRPGYTVYNLGTGKGYSVLDVVNAFEQVSGKQVVHLNYFTVSSN